MSSQNAGSAWIDFINKFRSIRTFAIKTYGLNIFQSTLLSSEFDKLKIKITFDKISFTGFSVTNYKKDNGALYKLDNEHYFSIAEADFIDNYIKIVIYCLDTDGTSTEFARCVINVYKVLELNSLCKWYILFDKSTKKEVGSIYVGLFPEIGKINLKNFGEMQDLTERISKYFSHHKKIKESLSFMSKKVKPEALIEKFMNYFIINSPKSSNIRFDEIQEILEMFKERKTRLLFLFMMQNTILIKNHISKEVSEVVKDVLKFALNNSKEHNDFLCCKFIADISQYIYTDEDCIYKALKKSMIFKSYDYYKEIFGIEWGNEESFFKDVTLKKPNISADAPKPVINRGRAMSKSMLNEFDHISLRITKVVKNFVSAMVLNGLQKQTILDYILKLVYPLCLSSDIINDLEMNLNQMFLEVDCAKNLFNSKKIVKKIIDERDFSNFLWNVKYEQNITFYYNNGKNKIKLTEPKKLNSKENISLLKEKFLKFYESEYTILWINNVFCSNFNVLGKLFLTNFRLLFIPEKIERMITVERLQRLCELPLRSIFKFEVVKQSKTLMYYQLNMKDCRRIKYAFSCEESELEGFTSEINRVLNIRDEINVFAFSYSEISSIDIEGWEIYNVNKEYERQNVPKSWTISSFNEKFDICETYPQLLVLPSNMSYNDIKNCSKRRSKNRLPVLCYYSAKHDSCLIRSSQPANGVISQTLNNEEKTLQENYKITRIIDARPKINAMVNIASGGGYEKPFDKYQVLFCNIQNIHVMRESLFKLMDVLHDKNNQCLNYSSDETVSEWLDKIKSCGWLDHIRTILTSAKMISSSLQLHKENILVHCSDGWDRTPQLTALTQVLLDSFYRTLKGFLILISKEFISFGHMFSTRNGNIVNENQYKSPVFIQFLDCVYQILIQFSHCFEFNHYLLEKIADCSFSCKYGTFLFNNEKSRFEKKVAKKTISLWTNILINKEIFINPFFIPVKDILSPKTNSRNIVIWPYYTRTNLEPKYAFSSVSTTAAVHRFELESKIAEINLLKMNLVKADRELLKIENLVNKYAIKTQESEMKNRSLLEKHFSITSNLLKLKETLKKTNIISSKEKTINGVCNGTDLSVIEKLIESIEIKLKTEATSTNIEELSDKLSDVKLYAGSAYKSNSKRVKSAIVLSSKENLDDLHEQIFSQIRDRSLTLRHISLNERNTSLDYLKCLSDIRNRKYNLKPVSKNEPNRKVRNEILKKLKKAVDGKSSDIKPPESHPPNMSQSRWDAIRELKEITLRKLSRT